ncbi:MAG: hypothetical protein M1812_006000 [Candelaria pacifica]|nr:MAG: hypothetical protein M1812_006000 [Candelaria pacifica]
MKVVRPPGRPLSTCPHPQGPCNCNVTTIAFPKASTCVCGANQSPATSVEITSPARAHHEPSLSIPARRLSKVSTKKAKHGRTMSVVDGPVPLAKASQDEEDFSQGDKASSIYQKPLPTGVAQFTDEVLSPTNASYSVNEAPHGADHLVQAQQEQPRKSCCQSKQQILTPSYTQLPTIPSFPQPMPFALPPNVGTPQYPLTPDFYFSRQQSHPVYVGLNPQYAPPGVSRGSSLNPTSIPTAISSGLGHSCSCGDACNCLGCAVHPYNPRMLTWVHDLNHLVHQNIVPVQPYGGHYPTNNEHPGFAPMHMPQSCPGNAMSSVGLQPNPTQTCASHRSGPVISNQPHRGHFCNSPNTGTNFKSVMTTSTPSSETQGPWPVWPNGTSAEIENPDEAGPSPSDFFYVSYPGCGTSVSSCKCGDGCTCSGCLTHAGHDGLSIPQQPPPGSEYWTTSPTTLPQQDPFASDGGTPGGLDFHPY